MIVEPDTAFGAAAATIRAKMEEHIFPILKELEASGKLTDKATKSMGHMMDEAEGTLRGVWKYSWRV